MRTIAPFCLIFISVVFSLGCKNEKANPPSSNSKPETQSAENSQVDSAALQNSIVKAYMANDFKKASRLVSRLDLDASLSTELLYFAGEVYFAAGQPEQSVAAYDKIIELQPELKPQLWQRGLALYYAGDYDGGVDQLESHQNYNSQDVENSVWHLLMKAKLSSVEDARKQMIPISRDGRVPMKEIFDMFAGTGSPDSVLKACRYDETVAVPDSAIYHGWLYIGLYHEMMGDPKAANHAMEQALRFNPLSNGLMAHIAKTHLSLRSDEKTDR